MAYSTKTAQRAATTVNYAAAKSTLTSDSVEVSKMSSNGSAKLWGSMGKAATKPRALVGTQDTGGSRAGASARLWGMQKSSDGSGPKKVTERMTTDTNRSDSMTTREKMVNHGSFAWKERSKE